MVDPTFADFESGAVFIRNTSGTLLRVMSPDNKQVLWPDLVVKDQPVAKECQPEATPSIDLSVSEVPSLYQAKTRRRRSKPVPISVSTDVLTSLDAFSKIIAALHKQELLKMRQSFEAGNDDFFEALVDLKVSGLGTIFAQWAGELLLKLPMPGRSDTEDEQECRNYIMGGVQTLLLCVQFLDNLDKLDKLSAEIEKEFPQSGASDKLGEWRTVWEKSSLGKLGSALCVDVKQDQ